MGVMTAEDRNALNKMVLEKIELVLSAITQTSSAENDKCAAEAAQALMNVMLNLQLCRVDRKIGEGEHD